MRTVTVDLFSGLGGFALASHMMGWETLILCEIDDNCKVVLAHHFPDAYIHGDIHTLTGDLIREKIKEKYGDEPIRLVVLGGFPCQPYSAAGKRLGKEDSRHLWPEMLRVIRECRPDAVVGENVSGIVSWDGGLVFEEVQTDLEAEGYEVQAVVVPACSVGAPHRRDRVWFVANRNGLDRNSDIQRLNEKQGKEVFGKEQSPDTTGVGEQNKRDVTHAQSERLGESGECLDRSKKRNCGIGSVWPPPNPRLPESQGRDEATQRQQHGGWRLAWSQLASFGGAWPFAYATNYDDWRNFGKEKGRQESKLRGRDESPNAPNADVKRLRRQSDGQGNARQFGETGAGSHWQNFPTEPPLRVGDDGISARLGRVCLPGTKRKLTESAVNKMGLKMAGNAVVPQVVFQIFKALEATW